MTSRSRLALAVAAVVAAVVLVSPASAVTFGEPDGTSHPYVGTVLLRTASGYYGCSGTLLSPTVFLTAGHCTEEAGVPNLESWVSFAPVISFAGRQNYASLADFLNDPSNGWITGSAVPHPQYDDYAQFPATYDVGLILLNQPVTMSVYGVLPPPGFLDTLQKNPRANSFTVVGYGMQGYIKPFYEDTYARYHGTLRLIETKSTFNAGMSAKFTNNPGIGGGTCFGDSGGPILYDRSNMVVAVVSWGITPCIGVDYQFRLDTALAQEFISQYLP